MPSSLIIVALVVAWLVVLVPMVARKRQAIARTADSAMAARVVRSGSSRTDGPEEFVMSDKEHSGAEQAKDDGHEAHDVHGREADLDDLEYLEDLEDQEDPEGLTRNDEADEAEEPDAPQPDPPSWSFRAGSGPRREYRPGRGGFDPEAAELAAKAKYAHRQRVVVGLLVLVVLSAILAAALWSTLWFLNIAADIALLGYLIYLRRQVRIEDEIRQRRLARYNEPRGRAATAMSAPAEEKPQRKPAAREPEHDVEVVVPQGRELVGSERKPSPTSRQRRQAVVIDVDDEDPAFHELDEPGTQPFRRASGE